MRKNLPVVAEEYPLEDASSLVSSTDLQGRILHCNEAFILASGFERDELLGQPHNLIRHPDMPPAAFEDMWRTIRRASPWTGLVKNRRKDGRFYWVLANVTPLVEAGDVVGYLSVRTVPDREAVAAAEELCAQMRDDTARSRARWEVVDGQARRRGLAGGPGRANALVGEMPMPIAIGVAALSGWSARAFGPSALAAPLLLAVVGAVGWWAHRRAERPLRAALGPMNSMAAGDLASASTPVAGGLGRALSQLKVNLRAIVGDAHREIQRMRLATREIADGNADLSARTESQAANIEQTAATMEQITGAVRLGADAAACAAGLAQDARARTRDTLASVGEVARGMREIAASSKRIGEIISLIEGVAFRTNLLALNAAVEAARAGEQGRGFAVVASEVRALAGQTAEAAREVKSLIEQSADCVNAGQRVTDQTCQRIEDAARSVDRVHDVVCEISAAAHEQLLGISQVGEAVAQLDTLTQQNAALVEQTAAASMALQRQTDNVAAAFDILHLGDHKQVRADAAALRRMGRRSSETSAA